MQAQRHAEAAKLLIDAAEQLAGRQASPLQVKKLYVLAALEVEAYRKQTMSAPAAGDIKAARAAGSAVLTGGKRTGGAANTLAGKQALHCALLHLLYCNNAPCACTHRCSLLNNPQASFVCAMPMCPAAALCLFLSALWWLSTLGSVIWLCWHDDVMQAY